LEFEIDDFCATAKFGNVFSKDKGKALIVIIETNSMAIIFF
jgi:hypothetical protein